VVTDVAAASAVTIQNALFMLPPPGSKKSDDLSVSRIIARCSAAKYLDIEIVPAHGVSAN
jgi:hypothetical protein